MHPYFFLIICLLTAMSGCVNRTTSLEQPEHEAVQNDGKTYPQPFEQPVTIGKILFRSDSTEVNQALWSVLDGVAMIAVADPGLTVTLEGHSDVRGSRNHNKQLSADRVRAVANHLVRNGVATNRIVRQAYGESRAAINVRDSGGQVFDRQVTISLSRVTPS